MSLIKIKSLPDFVSGVMFAVIGAAVVWLAGNYSPGTAARMGPGYFPRLLGGVLTLLGLVIGARALTLRSPSTEREAFALRTVLFTLAGIAAFWIMLGAYGKAGITGLDFPVVVMLILAFFAGRELFWVLAGIAAFGFALLPLGLVVATFALVFIASIASHEFSWKATLACWLVLLALSLGVFAYGLKLQFPVWPPFIAH